MFRSSHLRRSVRKGVLSQNSQENTCARISFLIKLQATLLKKRLWHKCFSCEFCEIFKNIFFTEPSGRLLLDITPVFTKDDPAKVKNYRRLSVLTVVLKVFERIMHKQITEYINQFLSPYLCRHREGFSTQQALLSLI